MKGKLIAWVIVFFAGAVLFFAAGVHAESEPYVFNVAGAVCVSYDGQLECFCPCNDSPCNETPSQTGSIVTQTITPGVTNQPQTITPAPTNSQTNTPAPDPTPIPPTSDPEPEREHCDQGRGNGDDECSPGNSDNQHEPNDPQPGPRR